ncbi:hypothetical protein CN378_05320 [Bacillus sp. AFS015802]|uniref:hypothetical protein n=1 Tax=Bacillus sp. AFS015802 TaxID=2033486 RepID=UPI000BF54694|nr:hypothetical protein [Bacillus sp. AFS015802]PFA68902.1 hypothetical protein CN378_05320 [Bacillus sp. AFS015802]
MTFKQIRAGTAVGIISGIILGLFLKWMQGLTGIKVYILLLNVDFIPVFASKHLPESLEFFFHLLISCVIGVAFVYLLEKLTISSKGAWLLSLLLTFPTVFLYFPLSYMAVKEVPGMLNGTAILLWTAGHLVYALSLPPLYKFTTGWKSD